MMYNSFFNINFLLELLLNNFRRSFDSKYDNIDIWDKFSIWALTNKKYGIIKYLKTQRQKKCIKKISCLSLNSFRDHEAYLLLKEIEIIRDISHSEYNDISDDSLAYISSYNYGSNENTEFAKKHACKCALDFAYCCILFYLDRKNLFLPLKDSERLDNLNRHICNAINSYMEINFFEKKKRSILMIGCIKKIICLFQEIENEI